MLEWKETIQRMIDWIEDNLDKSPGLLELSAQIGYSPCYCSYLFHQVTGRTLRSYLAARRLSGATLALRDTDKRILDVALENGYLSQEALTRAFVKAYGCTPGTYRKKPSPITLPVKLNILFPEDYFENGGIELNNLREANVRFEYIPAHKYIGIWEPRAANYGDFWNYHDCDEICGIIESMRHVAHEVVGSHMAGWYRENGKRCYFYGFGVSTEYDGEVPEGFSIKECPASLYLAFFHPPFDFHLECGEVMARVEELAWNFKPIQNKKWLIPRDYEWNEDICQDYQRHFPEVLGYEVLRPIRPVSKS